MSIQCPDISARKYKIHVPNKSLQTAVQQKLFSLEYTWWSGISPKPTEPAEFLFIYTEDKVITWGSAKVYFMQVDVREISLEKLFAAKYLN